MTIGSAWRCTNNQEAFSRRKTLVTRSPNGVISVATSDARLPALDLQQGGEIGSDDQGHLLEANGSAVPEP